MLTLRTWRTALKPVLMAAALIGALVFTTGASQAADPLPSWNDGPAKQSIINFVERVTTPGSPDFVPVSERIATFDNDGTLWCEQPMPVQLYFVLDRVKALAPQHPEWNTMEPFASFIKGDLQTALAGGDHALLEVMMATHAGMTTAEFTQIVKGWIATARHPKTGQLFTDMVYQPMLEVLSYLRANGFKNFIVSGGGIEFTFNGHSFDLPVLRYRAMVNRISAVGLQVRDYFHRYTDDAIDLCDLLGSYVPGGKVKLDEVSKILGLPGKPEGVHGSRWYRQPTLWN
jgi:phosphoserine phosphatase